MIACEYLSYQVVITFNLYISFKIGIRIKFSDNLAKLLYNPLGMEPRLPPTSFMRYHKLSFHVT